MPSPAKMSKHCLNLPKAFPWLNSTVLEVTSVHELFLCGALKPYGGKIEPVLRKLASFEDMNTRKESKVPLRQILQTAADSMISSRLQELSSLPQEDMSSLVSYLLDYRLIDVAIYLQWGLSPAGQTLRLPIPLPPKMYFKQAGNWPALVNRGLQLLQDCEEDVPMPDSLDSTRDATSSIFVSLLYRRDTIEGNKIMGNFQCVAAHLSLIFKGIVDLPSTLSEFKTLVVEMCADHGLPAERWETFFDSMKTPQAFKLPLHLALSCSPICLFLPSNLMTKDLNRLVLLQMWQGLGGPRPRYLQLVEATLWRALFESALGVSPVSSRLKRAFQDLNGIDLGVVGYPDLEWLGGSATFSGTLPTLVVPRKRSPKPASTTSGITPSSVSQRLESAPHVGSIEEARPMTRSRTAVLKPEPNTPQIESSEQGRGAIASQPRGSAWRRPTNKSGSSKGKARAVSKTTTSSEHEPDETALALDFGLDVQQVSVALKRTSSALSVGYLPSPQSISIKALKLEDGSRSLRVYETIDLTSETVTPPMIDLTLDCEGEEDLFASPAITLWDAHDRVNYVPKFHHSQEAGWFSMLTRVLKGCQPHEYPQHIKDKSSSMLHLLDRKKAWELPVGETQDYFRSFVIILVPDSLQSPPFNSTTLGRFCMLDKVTAIRDFSASLIGGDRMVTGSLDLLLQSAERYGKVLLAPDVPIPGEAPPLFSLASDVHAWDMTIDQPWCGRRWELPRSAVRWAEISTRNAYRSLGISLNGFATQIEVTSGSQLLVVCQPSPFNPHSISSIVTLEQLRNPYITDTKTLNFQAIHLQAGYSGVIGPMVPFMLLSTKHSVVQMSHFYASSTLRASCVGFLYSALTVDPSLNQSQKAAQSLLRRLVHYFHLVYTGRDQVYLHSRKQFPHVPDVLTSTGVIQLLSICNVFEIMNILAYTLSSLDRHMLIETRRLCRRVVAWLDARLRFTDCEGSSLDVSTDLWKAYLAHQIKMLHVYQASLEKRGISPRASHAVRSKLDAYSKEDPALLSHLQDLEARYHTADDFEWPDHLQFAVTLRLSPGEISGDIRGETGDDLAHFAGAAT